jgi:hypothetical protein
LIANPNFDITVTKSDIFISLDGSEFIEPVFFVDKTPADKELTCRFSPRRSLE